MTRALRHWWNRVFEKRLASAFAWGDCIQVAGGEILVIDRPERNQRNAALAFVFGMFVGWAVTNAAFYFWGVQ